MKLALGEVLNEVGLVTPPGVTLLMGVGLGSHGSNTMFEIFGPNVM